jgi:hypothetical protein
MSSYSFGAEYGTDEINVGSDDIRDYLNADDSNEMSKINAIKDRETRLMQKIKHYTPTCGGDYKSDPCNPDVYSIEGQRRHERRRDIAKNIEDHYFSNREMRSRCTPTKKTDYMKRKTEGFNIDEIIYLHDEMEDLEKKNNMLVMFIFFLVVIVLVQYAKCNNDINKPVNSMYIPNIQKSPPNSSDI